MNMGLKKGKRPRTRKKILADMDVLLGTGALAVIKEVDDTPSASTDSITNANASLRYCEV